MVPVAFRWFARECKRTTALKAVLQPRPPGGSKEEPHRLNYISVAWEIAFKGFYIIANATEIYGNCISGYAFKPYLNI